MRFFRIPFNSDEEGSSSENRPNRLQKYIHAQSVQDMSRLASEISPDVRQIIGSNVQALLGYLPPTEFNTSITASKENFQNLLASAMLTGYFMHAMENRMHMDDLFESDPDNESDTDLDSDLDSSLEKGPTTLQHPEDLFGTQDTLLDSLTPEELQALSEEVRAANAADPDLEIEIEVEKTTDNTSFFSTRELSSQTEGPENSDKLNIQLEINTRMNRAELTHLLKELRNFQEKPQPEEIETLEPLQSLDSLKPKDSDEPDQLDH